MRFLLILIVVVMLGGCSTTPVILKHPTTGETAQCGPYSKVFPRFLQQFSGVPKISVGLRANASAQREIACVNDYQAQGYQRVKN